MDEPLLEQIPRHLADGGRQLLQSEIVELGDRSNGKNALKSMTGGKFQADRLCLFIAQSWTGIEIYVQPMAGATPLPGEYHVELNGALRAPASYTEGWVGHNWSTDGDDELQKWLRREKFEAHHVPDKLKHGLVKMDLEWLIHLWPIATDRSRLCIAMGGLSIVGATRQALRVVDAIGPAVGVSSATGPVEPLGTMRFDSVADSVRSQMVL